MKELEIQTLLKRKKEIFFKCGIDYIIKHSARIEENDIYDLSLNKKLFNIDNIDKDKYYVILIAISDKKGNILETRNINIRFKDKKIKFNLRHLINEQVLDNYIFHISVIPLIEENKEIIKKFIKPFYSSIKLFNKNKIFTNKFQIFSIFVLVFSISFTLLQVDITNKLITNYGQTDNIINNITVFNSIVLYFYDDFFVKNLFAFTMPYLLILSIFVFPSIISFIVEFIFYIWKRSCIFNKKEFLYLNIRLTNSVKDIKSNFIEVCYNPNFIFKYSLIYIFFMLILFIPVMKVYADQNIKNNLNFKGKIIEKYFASSVFPSFIEIKEANEEKKKIFAIGYDVNYLYYYDYEYIKDILNRDFKSFDNSKYKTREMKISEVYAYYLNNLLKDELKYIKVKDYKMERTLPDKYYEINKK